jgi:SM-20-related protein
MDAAGADAAAGALCAALAARGYASAERFLPPRLVARLRLRLRALDAAGAFRPAAVGAGAHRAVRPQLRGDRLCWLEPPLVPAEQALLAALERLRATLNRELGLGLFDVECQYAAYAPGAVYVRHLDRSPAGAERVLSAVLYLNAGWQPADGGELVLYAEPAPVLVRPRAATLVLFESARFEHEVRAARRERLSVAAWFRRRARPPR